MSPKWCGGFTLGCLKRLEMGYLSIQHTKIDFRNHLGNGYSYHFDYLVRKIKKLIFFNILFLIKENGNFMCPKWCGSIFGCLKRLVMGYLSIQDAKKKF